MNERLETIQKLDETILENTKGRDIEKEVEDCGEFCANVYRIFARIDLSLEDAKNSLHLGTSPSFSQINNNVKSNKGVKVKLPKLELMSFSGKYEEWQSFWTEGSLRFWTGGQLSLTPGQRIGKTRRALPPRGVRRHVPPKNLEIL